jgi:1-deoxy-D-xylulose-5-phosphate reductoisomerase
MNKKIAILGATGSVGSQALDVARARGYSVQLISAHTDYVSAESLARELHPDAVCMTDPVSAGELRRRLCDTSVRVLSGCDELCSYIEDTELDTVVNAIMGSAGLTPTLSTLRSGKRLALANKESLVTAGELVKQTLREGGGELIPVDSEHSAIFQSMKSGTPCEIKRIILTASGGPFFGYTSEMLERVTLADTLKHPTWRMGKRITVDSATLMNKGFEVIEAVHLFNVPPEKIDVVIHRESILHSAVEYIDNTVIGEMSVPDMRMCVQYAVDYPHRCPTSSESLDLFKVGTLSFFKPDTEAFPLLALAYDAIRAGGATPAALNAADEVAVAAFLSGMIAFSDIPRVVSATLEGIPEAGDAHTLDSILSVDRDARRIASDVISTLMKIG